MKKYINPNLLEKFEFYNYGHALEILNEAFPAVMRSPPVVAPTGGRFGCTMEYPSHFLLI